MGANPSNTFIYDMNPSHQSVAIAQNCGLCCYLLSHFSHGEALVFYLLDEENFLQLLIFKCSLVGPVARPCYGNWEWNDG